MKRMQLFSAALALALLTGCAGTASQPRPEAAVRSGTIAYVPLDDRPDNLERVEYLAASLGYQLLMPEEDWFSTKLDGQPLNENGTQYGDREQLYAWVLGQEAAGCNRYILSLDQLLSGGLVSSRAMAGDNPFSLPDGTAAAESEALEQLLAALSADPGNQVWLLDTVMRLAPTYGYGGFTLNEYNTLRTYAMESRPALAGDALTVANIVSDYALGADGAVLAAVSQEPLPAGAVEGYLASRERKLRLSDEAQRLLSGAGYEKFHLLIGIDDSAEEDSIQKNELAYLRAGLRTNGGGAALDWILSGVDDLAFKAVTKLYLLESGGWAAPPVTAEVTYFGGTEDAPACDYDYLPLREIVAEHLAFFDVGELRTDLPQSWANLQILVLTQPAEESEKDAYCQALIDRLVKNQGAETPTILIDASNGAYGTAFHERLVDQCSLGFLLSYAGFLDMAIVTGTALSHGLARYAWLRDGNGSDAASARAFCQGLTESLALDLTYKNDVRYDVIACARDTLGGDPNNFCAPAIDRDAVTAVLSDGMDRAGKKLLQNLSRSNLLISLEQSLSESDGNLSGWGSVALSNWSFPWNRAFEVRMDISVGALEAPHRKLLGLFWR